MIFEFLVLKLVYPPIFSLIRSFLVFSHLVCLYVCLSVCPFLRNDVAVTILQADWIPTILGQSPTIVATIIRLSQAVTSKTRGVKKKWCKWGRTLHVILLLLQGGVGIQQVR